VIEPSGRRDINDLIEQRLSDYSGVEFDPKGLDLLVESRGLQLETPLYRSKRFSNA
jgi:hypothetical protein